ncbi:MAG TPA: YkvA family protein, partial [Candidatus Saccharimonadales bacterium]|nr:YkvA family protein [Candidatus Saccharimonadales bacterium]
MEWRILAIVVAGILALWSILIGVLWMLRPRDVGLGELLRVIPDIARLVRRLLGDHTVPMGPKVALGVLLVWLISPIDLIPEFIPVLGPLDDVVVAVLVLRYVRRKVGLEELRSRWP